MHVLGTFYVMFILFEMLLVVVIFEVLEWYGKNPINYNTIWYYNYNSVIKSFINLNGYTMYVTIWEEMCKTNCATNLLLRFIS